MEDKDWFWQDNSYELDIESPLAISRSLWDGLAQSEADSRTLFSTTPAAEIVDSYQIVSSFGRRDTDASTSIYDDGNCALEGSPRSKRRRMLSFSANTDESSMSGTSVDADLDPSSGSHNATMMPNCEAFEKYDMPPSPSSQWYLKQDDPYYSLNDVLDPPKWMVRSNGDPSYGTSMNASHDPTKLVDPASDISGSTSSEYQQPSSCESDAIDWPRDGSTSHARSSPSTPVWRPSALHGRPKSSTPVAYPFALLKPCGAQGDVTLNDINQRISMPPSRPPSQRHFGGDDSRRSSAQSGPSPSSSGGSPGLPGKSVVGLTKIHTEGNGTITIVRTRGG